VIAAPALQSTNYSSNLTSQNLVPTYADLLINESILKEVIQQLGLSQTTVSLAKMINVSPIGGTSTIKISIDGTDRAQIAQIANTLVEVFIEKINALQSDRFTSTKENLQKELASIDSSLQVALTNEAAATDPSIKSELDAKVLQYQSMYATVLTTYEQVRLAEVQATSNVVQIDKAGISYKQVSPRTLLYTLLAGLMGIVLTTGVILARDVLDNTIKSVDEITHSLNLPVLGVIYKNTSKRGLISQTEQRSSTSDAFRSLRTNLQHANVNHPLQSILVTSASPAEGKTTVSINLAIVLAQAGNKVTLIDADFHLPKIHERLRLANTRGLTVLLGRPHIKLDDILQPTSVSGLSVITAGEVIPPNATEILASKNMVSVLKFLLDHNSIVLLDSPPILSGADTKILAPLMDGVLLVVQPGKTTLQTARQAVENLRQVNATIIGVVVNNVDLKTSGYQHYFHNT
jgi:non-specific protein-tyrosine kinase